MALGTDDLGVLKEGEESNEDVLRRQLLEKDRENDKVIQAFTYLLNLLAEACLWNFAAAYPDPITTGSALPASVNRNSSGA
jgi:hypothetical protein